MSTLLRSPSRQIRLLAAGAVRLLVAAILVQPAVLVVRVVVPAESAEAQESEPAGESESAESELTTTPASHAERFLRRCDRREPAPPGTVTAKVATAAQFLGPGPATGHRLRNGLTAPLRC